jgi:hypothetical protein
MHGKNFSFCVKAHYHKTLFGVWALPAFLSVPSTTLRASHIPSVPSVVVQIDGGTVVLYGMENIIALCIQNNIPLRVGVVGENVFQ